MSFNAYKASRDAIEATLSDIDTMLTTVCAESGRRVVRHKAIYRVTNPRNLNVPCLIIGQARGNVDDASSRSIRTTVTVPVMIALTGSDPESVDQMMDDYLTAVVRLFAGTDTASIRFSVADFDAEMPAPYDGANLMQTGVVNVTCYVSDVP